MFKDNNILDPCCLPADRVTNSGFNEVNYAGRMKKLLKWLPTISQGDKFTAATVLLTSPTYAIDRHRYDVIDSKAPSSTRLIKHLTYRIQSEIRGLYGAAFLNIRRGVDKSKEQQLFIASFVDTNMCIINPSEHVELLVVSHVQIIMGTLLESAMII